MNEFPGNIALFLLVIFIYPITFQPIHVVWHHSFRVARRENIYYTCCSENSGAEIIPKIHHCPICDYELVVNSLPEHIRTEFFIPEVNVCFINVGIKNFIDSFIFIKQSRAPPLQFF